MFSEFGVIHGKTRHGVWNSKYFLLIGPLFVAALMISNTVSTKLIKVGPYVFAGAIFIFPISYIFGDVLTGGSMVFVHRA